MKDILLHFDLPQLTAGLAGRKVTVSSPVDGMKRPVDPEAARRTYAIADEAFRRAGTGQFKIS